MNIQLVDGSMKTVKLSHQERLRLRGIRLDSVTLDHADILVLEAMAVYPEDIREFLKLLRIALHKPKPVFEFEPLDAEQAELKRQGKDYLVQATRKN